MMFWVNKLQHHWDAFSTDSELNLVDPIEVKLNDFFVFFNLARSEDDWDFDAVSWKQDLSWRELDVKIRGFLEDRFN